ncbi:MAG: hypothetical protein V7707_05355 [Motiliproteus sp.]
MYLNSLLIFKVIVDSFVSIRLAGLFYSFALLFFIFSKRWRIERTKMQAIVCFFVIVAAFFTPIRMEFKGVAIFLFVFLALSIRPKMIERFSFNSVFVIGTCFLVLMTNIFLSKVFLAERQFFSFEHANILGSYILCLSPMILMLERRYIPLAVFSMIFLCYLSTSGGAFISSFLLFFLLPSSLLLRVIFIIVPMLVVFVFINPTVVDAVLVKLYYPYLFFKHVGFSSIYDAVQSRSGVVDFGVGLDNSFVWRIYAYTMFLSAYFESSVFEMILGRGWGGYKDVWSGAMPHNDLILILIDFGFVGFFLTVTLFFVFIRKRVAIDKRYAVLAIIICLRLFFENNINSFYLVSTFFIFDLVFVNKRKYANSLGN